MQLRIIISLIVNKKEDEEHIHKIGAFTTADTTTTMTTNTQPALPRSLTAKFQEGSTNF